MNLKTVASFLKKPVGIALLVFAAAVVLSIFIKINKPKPVNNLGYVLNANYVGSVKCENCHQKEYSLYQSSDHFHAMDSALPRSVRGDFNNSYFVYLGDTSFFYQRDGKYYVRTKDS